MSYLDELTRESAEVPGAWNNPDWIAVRACAEVDRLRAELAEARKDSERLDWIGSRASTELILYATAGWSIRKARIGEEDLLKDANIYDLRSAIDAARAQSGAPERKEGT